MQRDIIEYHLKPCIPIIADWTHYYYLTWQFSEPYKKFSAWEKGSAKAKRYIIKNSNGQLMFYAVQEASGNRSFSSKHMVINIIDNLNRIVMKIDQEIKCCNVLWLSNWFKSCSNRVLIEAPVGKSLGFVEQKSSLTRPYFNVFDENNRILSRVEGPCCLVNVDFNLNFQEMICPLENYFTIMPPDRNLNIGRISKQFASTVADVNTKTIDHRFGTTMPVDMSINVKSNILGFIFSLSDIRTRETILTLKIYYINYLFPVTFFNSKIFLNLFLINSKKKFERLEVDLDQCHVKFGLMDLLKCFLLTVFQTFLNEKNFHFTGLNSIRIITRNPWFRRLQGSEFILGLCTVAKALAIILISTEKLDQFLSLIQFILNSLVKIEKFLFNLQSNWFRLGNNNGVDDRFDACKITKV
ncbi:phospholipid scramblase 1-like isoform X2 [Brachionus plicatilis]|uniref:Phospholipid scramblase n=1 Tax=Brachionus plicatilis TaxID=10195 RepID=A0A3M7RPA5_BRAPC|nr:phospholipid scramblase 1-like isoform X2 [Brachionus plicatilis]